MRTRAIIFEREAKVYFPRKDVEGKIRTDLYYLGNFYVVTRVDGRKETKGKI